MLWCVVLVIGNGWFLFAYLANYQRLLFCILKLLCFGLFKKYLSYAYMYVLRLKMSNHRFNTHCIYYFWNVCTLVFIVCLFRILHGIPYLISQICVFFFFTFLKMEWKIKFSLSMTNMLWSFSIFLFNKLTMSSSLPSFCISYFALHTNTIAHFSINKLRPYTGEWWGQRIPLTRKFRVAKRGKE